MTIFGLLIAMMSMGVFSFGCGPVALPMHIDHPPKLKALFDHRPQVSCKEKQLIKPTVISCCGV